MIRTLRAGLPVALVASALTILAIGTAQEPSRPGSPTNPAPLGPPTAVPPVTTPALTPPMVEQGKTPADGGYIIPGYNIPYGKNLPLGPDHTKGQGLHSQFPTEHVQYPPGHIPHQPGTVDHHMPPGHLAFGTSILVISTDLPNKPGAILHNVAVYSIGCREFLWGEVPPELGKPWKQTVPAPVLISLDHITQIVPYMTIEDAMKALGMHATPGAASCVNGSISQ